MLFTSFCEVEHRATEHLNISAKNIYESCRKEESFAGHKVLYKINTSKSVLIRGNNFEKKKKKKKWDSNAYQNIIDTLTLCDPRSYYHDYDWIVNFFWILNVFSIKGKNS